MLVWTVAIVIPIAPFSYIQPIMVGGGPGVWFLVGYLLYAAVGVGGFGAFSSFLFAIEIHERRAPSEKIMLIGFVLSFIGVLSGCLLLGIAGLSGGYVIVVEHSTTDIAQNVLSPFVNPITAACLVSVIGAGACLYGMAAAKATET
jgi:hypothetical protein